MNTHDMPPFASFWRGSDLQLRLEEGHIDARRARQLATERGAVRRALVHSLAAAGWLEGENAGALAEASEDLEIARILRACLAYLSAGPDRLTMVSLEDLWLERQPQNVPASTDEHPNWRRRARFAFEEMRSLPGVVDTLREVDRLRRAGEGE